MSPLSPSRRELLAGSVAAGLTATLPALPGNAEPFGYCLNTATIMGQKLPLAEQVEVAARAGYGGLEPWVRDLDKHVQSGGSLKDVAKRIRDRGVSVESAIGFAEWAVDDDKRRQKGLEQARREMSMVAELGGKRIAAPPAGATDRADQNLFKVAERYRALLEIGANAGVIPQLEIWGFSRSIRHISEAIFVAIESNHPQACVLADVYHLYKGGSDFGWVRLLGPAAFGVFHVNDYPAKPPRAEITDADRVYPGDGVAPLIGFFRDLHTAGYRGMLSVEVFNREYWKQDALAVARTGLEKLRAVVRRAIVDKP